MRLAATTYDGSEETDDELLARSRAGDRMAFSELYRRHRAGAHRFATSLTRDPMRASDLVSDAFIKIMTLVDQGRGPESNFGAYLTTTIRTTHIDHLRSHRKERLVEDVARVGDSDSSPSEDLADARVEANLVTRAFLSLPTRWREVLWYTEVHDEPHDLVASRFGINKNAVAVLCWRAREGLRQKYLAEHLALSAHPACQSLAPLIPQYLRGQLSLARTTDVERHLRECAHCPAAVGDLKRLSTSLGAIIAPIVVYHSGQALGAGASVSGAALATSKGGGAHAATKTAAVWKGVAAAAGVAVVVGVVQVLAHDTGKPASADPLPPAPQASHSPPPSTPTRTPSSPPTSHSAKPSPSPTPTPPAPTASPTAMPRSATPPSPDPVPATLGSPRVSTVRASGATAVQVITTAAPATESLRVTISLSNATDLTPLGANGWTCRHLTASAGHARLVCRAPAEKASARAIVFGFQVVDPQRAATGDIGLEGSQTTATRTFTVSP